MAVVEAEWLAVAVLKPVGHDWHVFCGGNRNRPSDDVGKGDLVTGFLQLLAAGIKHAD